LLAEAEDESLDIKMLIMTYAKAALLGVAILSLTDAPAFAQQITGVPGSSTATTTLDGKQLPPPPPKFGGVIKESAKDSTPWWPPRVVPPKGAPNVLLIMTDDQGYGVPGTFGGVIPTPALDRVAKAGLRYTEFNSTALCSPTRAALITGRNHHSVGFGVIGELSTGFPGYDSVIGPDNATIGEVLGFWIFVRTGAAVSWLLSTMRSACYSPGLLLTRWWEWLTWFGTTLSFCRSTNIGF
jgi:Sulfatase